jgi:DNA-binding NarL/FixJ family response regulator
MPLDHWKPEALTMRHWQTLRLMGKGNTNKQIGAELGISVKTAEKHRQAVLCHYKVSSTVSAVIAALKSGELDVKWL